MVVKIILLSATLKTTTTPASKITTVSSIHSYAYYFIDDVSITPGCCPVDMAFTNIVQPTCGSNNGSINLGVANSPICGENGSVSYLWSNGATTKNVANLAANTYTVTVTNQGGCTATLSTVLNNGGCCPTVVTINTTAATCGANNGSISAVVSNNPVRLAIYGLIMLLRLRLVMCHPVLTPLR